LTWSDAPQNYREGLHELINGELVQLSPESGLNNAIAQELFWVLGLSGVVPRQLIKLHACELQVPRVRPEDPLNRYPDLVILRPEHITLTQRRLTIPLDMSPPQLVVEVVSPGENNRERDYVHKRDQYAARGIPEYWMIDPEQQTVMVRPYFHNLEPRCFQCTVLYTFLQCGKS
jgi:Uma2 family endonuclease